ncbi:hypothetical protein PHLGIDRAFT_19556 [Phlebiopsis gigantea 11061_1 CR5-6]|uniref:Uncharacterized protein n=1 Tax=Phlebiopsis gigantea (strain 11061_1 CR5-6) TaxID=745531 RepID=A0A0C3S9A2_PHLG1|nr:hypothetical protein PHLGIDRAFT_19556 [Phlebiopsis gigantea 11061_1 CR5-6]
MDSFYDTHAMPPLTCNTLDSHQRARLIRSTRKLGAVLGTTPRLAEADEYPYEAGYAYAHDTNRWRTHSSRRHGSIFTLFPETVAFSEKASLYSTSSSNSSLISLTSMESRTTIDVVPAPKSTIKSRRSNAPRPLVLRINAVPVAPTDTRVPLSPITATPMSPTFSDIPPVPSADEIRRKRMAKLTRTLGENIPSEAVFPSAPQPRQHASVNSTECVLNPPPRCSSRVWVTTAGNGAWVGEWNRQDITEVQRKLRTLKVR